MTLAPGFHEVGRGMVATVVTHLEMTRPPQPSPAPRPDGLVLTAEDGSDLTAYRRLFRAVGQDWLWHSRLMLDDAELVAILQDDDVVLFTLRRDGVPVGLLEMDYRNGQDCEIAFFGLVPSETGKGSGAWLMRRAQEMAWEKQISRLWLHTCTLDSPQALGFYRKMGFTPFAQEVEIAPDPRISGLLPDTAAPHVPIIR